MNETSQPPKKVKGERLVRVKRRKKRSKNAGHHPWYKSSDLRNNLEVFGKLLLLLLGLLVLFSFAWLVLSSSSG